MLHKPTCVGVPFHAMIFEKLYAFLDWFAELVLRARRHGDNGAFNSQAGNYKSHNAPVVEASSSGSFFFAEEAADNLLCFLADDMAGALVAHDNRCQ
jgi:hypothetical protein